jgi:hypothetical protein
LFCDSDVSPAIAAAKSGNLSAIIALQEDGAFDGAARDMETGLNAVQFSILNGHISVLSHFMY